MERKSVPFNKSGIAKLPNDKPVTYAIENKSGKEIYIGKTKRGRVHDRLMEHLSNGKDPIPGATVKIQQYSSVKEASKKETVLIERVKPKYNKKGK